MNKKKLTAQFCIFLVVMLPFCFADEFEQEGESLIIEAKKYEPEVLRSDYMEQLNIPVRVILGAIRGAPISVPEIKTVSVQLIKQKEAQKENATVTGTSEAIVKDYVQGSPHFYKAPYPTLDNLGYIQITLKKIPQEHKVPKTIDLDFKVTITYEADITAFTIGGENVKTLKQATVETIKENSEEYSILGGGYYLRVISVRNQEATVEVLDSEFKTITTRTLKLGETSTSISLPKKEIEPTSIRLKLEDTRGAGAIRLSFKEGKEKSFEKGQEVYGGWKVYNFYLGSPKKEDYDYVSLRHKEFKPQIILTTEKGYNTIADLKEKIQKCANPQQCEIYEYNSISGIKAYKVEKESFESALDSLESIGLEGLKKIDPQGAEFIVKIEEGGRLDNYRRGDPIGSKDCNCKISGVTRDRVWISGVKTGTCAASVGRLEPDTRELRPGEPASICGTFLEVKEITTDQEAVITILPGTGRGKTTTYFSVHIPVEKRALQYTPEELQSKINKTQELIKKLDNTITKLQALVEGWTKVCLATAAVFTVMSFFQGMSGKAAEKKEEGAKPEEPGKEAAKEIQIQPPDGVKFSELKYGSSPTIGGTKISLIDKGTYYLSDGRMYLNNKDNPIAYVGAKFEYAPKDKTKKWYVLTSEGKFKETDQYYGEWRPGDQSGRNEVRFSQSGDIAVGLQSCGQLPSEYKNQCESAKSTYGSALVLVYFKNVDYFELWWTGEDGKYYGNENGKQDGDRKILEIDSNKPGFKDLKRRFLEMEDKNKRGETKYSFGGYTYDMGKLFNSGTGATALDCRMVMSEGQCKILFNACDPVMCPASRCNFKGRYRVPNDNVIQSGLIGSLILCLPNIKEGVIMPVCLSGILAALKNIRSILQGYVNCLQAALQDDKSVGVCDRIRSIFICQILWREAMTLLGLARGNLFDFVTGKGGGEYLGGVKGGVDKAKQTLDYFTGDYAKSVFAAYRGRSSEELGAIVCEKAIYGKVPLVGEILEDVTKAQNPVQFTAYIEEQPLYTQTGQESAYKLYYHIYAGAQKIDYKVYVKKGTKTYVCAECSGTLEPEGFVDKSTLFTQEQGYKEICVAINGKHECNLGRVISTSFGISQVNNYIMQQELSKNIKTEEDCRADIRGYIPKAQIEKTCSSANPATGKGSKEEDLWRKVGTCGKNKEGAFLGDCWMKLGELAQSNPEAYQSVVGGLCEDDGGKVCGQQQTCSGRQTTTAVKERYKNVVCCYGTCETDPKYEEFKAKVKEFAAKDKAYDEVYAKGVERCEDKEIATSDPFYPTDQLPTSWIEKTKDIKKEEKNEVAYFKGLMFLLCNNCGDAKKEFSTIPKDGEYFKEACGENKPEEGKGGIFFEKCKKETCDGKKTADVKKKEEEKKQLEAVKHLQLTKLFLTTPLGDKTLDMSKGQANIELETGGTYTINKLEFNDPVKKCFFYFADKEPTEVALDPGAAICAFSEKNEFSTIGVEADKLSLYVLGVSRDVEEEVYASMFNITLKEKSAKEGQQILLCSANIRGDTCSFCLTKSGQRCSDYAYQYGQDVIWFSHVETPQEHYSYTSKCKEECGKINPNCCYNYEELGTNNIKFMAK